MPTLHLPYKIPPIYDALRNQYAEFGSYFSLIDSYKVQKINYPDENSGFFWDKIFQKKTKTMPMENWRIKKVISLIDLGKSVLNLGVGKGEIEDVLLKRFSNLNYHGSDITNKTLAMLRNKFGSTCFSKESLSALSFSSKSFDQILLLEVIEHIKPSKTLQVLSEIHRVLVDNGFLIISVPINEHLQKIIPSNPNSHMRCYTPLLLKTELRLCGFDIVEEHYLSAFHTFYGIKKIVNDLLRIREYNNLIVLARKR